MSTENKQFSDIELVLYITGYNITAYEQFYERYSPRVYALIRRIIPDARVAQSVLINVFATFLKRIDLYDTSKDNVFTWLMLLTRNISLDVAKKIKQKSELNEYDEDYELNCLVPHLSPSINNIDSYGTAEKIKSYKDHLTEIQNLVFSVAYYEGLNEEELAKRLNLPSEKIRDRIIDAIDSLMRLYCEHENFTGSKKEIIDLIKLDVLGGLSDSDKNRLNLLKNNSSNFLWKELGDYQNLIALISTSLTIEQPPREILEKVLHNVESVLNGKVSDYAVSLHPEPKKPPTPEINPNPADIKKSDNSFSMRFKEPDHNPIFAFKKHETPNRFNEIVSPLAKSEKNLKSVEVNTESKVQSAVAEKNDFTKTVETKEIPVATKSLQPNSERFNLSANPKNTPTQAKENKEALLKDNKTEQPKTILPNSERFNIDVKTPQKPEEKKLIPEVSDKSDNLFRKSELKPTSDRFKTELKGVPESVENKISKTEPLKTEKTVTPAIAKSENKQVDLKSKIEKPTASDKIKEPVIKEKKTEKAPGEKSVEEIKSKESIKIDKLISRIEENKLPIPLEETELPENDEVLKLKKKLRRNFYLSAAVIAVLTVMSVYVYTNFSSVKNNPAKTTNNLVKSEVTPAVNSGNISTDVSVVPNQNEGEKDNPIIEPQKVSSEKVDSTIKMIPPVLSQENNQIEKNIDSNSLISNNHELLETPKDIVAKNVDAAPLTEVVKVEKEPDFFVAVEEQPKLIGGLQGLQSKITYPEVASRLGIEGKVIIQAIVDEIGNVTSVKTLKGIGGGCDEIAMNAVKDSKFIPGKQRGKPVKVQMTIPIVFKK